MVARTNSWLCRQLLAMAMGLLVHDGRAAPTNSTWFARVWQAEDGLPGNNVTGVAQSADGYLWVSTHNGLARFDGLRFQEIPVGIPSGRSHPLIRALTLVRGEAVWLALEGGVAVGLSPHATNVFTTASGLPSFRPLGIAQDAGGAVWIGYADGSACRIAAGQVARFTARDGLAGAGGCWLAADVNGQLWFAKDGRVGVFRDGQFVTLLTLDERVVRIGLARAGGIWVCAGLRLLKADESGQAAEMGRLPVSRTGTEPTVLYESRSGALWIGTMTGGLFRYDGRDFEAVASSHSDILALGEDREGNLWIGTGGGGLDRLRQRVLELQSVESGLPSETVRSICEDASGQWWVTTGNGGLARLQNGTWETCALGVPGSDAQATCVESDGHGGVWIGTRRGAGLLHWQNGKTTILRRGDGLGGETVRSLLNDREGNLWIGLEATNCLQRLSNGRLHTYTQPTGSRTIRAMTQDRAGNVWLGTSDGFLLRVSGDELVDETPHTVNPPRPIRSLYATPDGSVWIGYASAGVGRWRDGRFARIGTEQGLHDANVCAIAADAGGALWFGTDRGIFQVRQRELDSVVEGRANRVHSVVYGPDEMLPNLQAGYGYSPGALRGRDGCLRFPMRTGLALVHPDRVPPNRIPPPVEIERVLVDGKVTERLEGTGQLHLPPGHRKIEVDFVALSFTAPEDVRFKHQLDGWDESWIESGSASRNATYSRLPAGNYVFRVTACNAASVWNETGASLGFAVEPFLWQTLWFRVAALGVFTLVVALLARYVSFRHLRAQLRQLEQEAAVQKERARIAKDIHDDLGANLTQIALLGELAQQDLNSPDRLGEHIGKIAGTARSGVKSLEEIVWAVNPRNDTLAHLLDYVGQFTVDFLRAAGLRCRVDFPEQPPARILSTEVRHNLFLTVKEALNNIVKHAQASEVWLRASITDAALRLSVEDNGRGFDRAPDDAWADGLRNMRQRMTEIDGNLEITSQPGAGTKITLTAPWHTPTHT